MPDLLALISVEPGRTAALDCFIGSCLSEGGVWEHPRTSDGIHAIERVLERGRDALRVAGRIWEIVDQSLHAFWLELRRDDAPDRFAWVLYFDLIETSARRARNALSNHDDAEEIEWRAKLMGQATVEDGKLTIVPGSIRAEVDWPIVRGGSDSRPIRAGGRRRGSATRDARSAPRTR